MMKDHRGEKGSDWQKETKAKEQLQKSGEKRHGAKIERHGRARSKDIVVDRGQQE